MTSCLFHPNPKLQISQTDIWAPGVRHICFSRAPYDCKQLFRHSRGQCRKNYFWFSESSLSSEEVLGRMYQYSPGYRSSITHCVLLAGAQKTILRLGLRSGSGRENFAVHTPLSVKLQYNAYRQYFILQWSLSPHSHAHTAWRPSSVLLTVWYLGYEACDSIWSMEEGDTTYWRLLCALVQMKDEQPCSFSSDVSLLIICFCIFPSTSTIRVPIFCFAIDNLLHHMLYIHQR